MNFFSLNKHLQLIIKITKEVKIMPFIKNALFASILLSLSALSFADVSSATEADKTQAAYTQLCLAALKSEQEFLNTARELGISKDERDRLVCNDMAVEEFASNYRMTDHNTIATVE